MSDSSTALEKVIQSEVGKRITGTLFGKLEKSLRNKTSH